jgi:excisionase family DNA binding protein
MPELPKLINRQQVSEILSVGVISVDRLRQSGKLPYIKVGRLVRFEYQDVIQCLENLRKGV